MPLACLRTFFFPAFLASLLALCGALYLEFGLGLDACPLCQSQRLLLAAFSLVCLGGLLHRATERAYLWTALALALAGSALAARHVWLQGLYPPADMPCEQTMSYLLEQGTPVEWLHGLLLGSAECAPITWSFLDLSGPEWSLLAFLGLAVLVVLRLIGRRRLNPGESPES
ncbi:MAG: disulfide bond formation protein B [Paucimonas sp.]|jgi:disulfide bond formation protein DsbB|nr:disulfide bond formation protein B [Paucimonas sp.]